MRKFRSAQRHLLSGRIQDIVSLKWRDDCVSGSEYRHFFGDYLTQALGLRLAQADGDFWGRAWLVSDDHGNRVVLVEHETGLEILAVAGSIASLVALVPVIASGWNKLRDHFSGHPMARASGASVEIRQFDQTNVLIEQRAPSVEVYVLGVALKEHASLKRRIEELETELGDVKKRLLPNSTRRSRPSTRKKAKRR
jgi:hypothetical protein